MDMPGREVLVIAVAEGKGRREVCEGKWRGKRGKGVVDWCGKWK